MNQYRVTTYQNGAVANTEVVSAPNEGDAWSAFCAIHTKCLAHPKAWNRKIELIEPVAVVEVKVDPKPEAVQMAPAAPVEKKKKA